MSEENEDDSFLSHPSTVKHIEHGEQFAFGAMQGWRKSNEDFHKHLIPIDQHSWILWNYFAIFDGHNGFIHFRFHFLSIHILLLFFLLIKVLKQPNMQVNFCIRI